MAKLKNAFENWRKAAQDRKKNLDSGIGDDPSLMPREQIGKKKKKKKKKKNSNKSEN